MGETHFDSVTVGGRLQALGGIVGVEPGIDYYVDGANGSNSENGRSWATAKATITAALALAVAGDRILIAPGEYDEAVSIARAKGKLTLIGVGGRGAAYIAPSAANATALTNLADDVTVINVGCDGDGTGSGVLNYGARLRMVGCKIEGGTVGLKLTLATVAQEAADTHGRGADCRFDDCEICWNTKGVELVATDYGALTQARFRDCTFHDNTAADFEESGGSVDIRFRDLDIGRCIFLRQEDGTEPTAYILLNDDNGNKGVVHGCVFPSALNGGKNLVSTGLLWVGNFHPAGLSTGQPS
jgi:hypothetical protein